MNIRLYYLLIAAFFSVATIHAMNDLDFSNLPPRLARDVTRLTQRYQTLVHTPGTGLASVVRGVGTDQLNFYGPNHTIMQGPELMKYFSKMILAIADERHGVTRVSALIEQIVSNGRMEWPAIVIRAKAENICALFKEQATIYARAESSIIRRLQGINGPVSAVAASHPTVYQQGTDPNWQPDNGPGAVSIAEVQKGMRRFFAAVGIMTGIVGLSVIGWKIIKHYRDKKYKEQYT